MTSPIRIFGFAWNYPFWNRVIAIKPTDVCG
jgi:hypothetical protein